MALFPTRTTAFLLPIASLKREFITGLFHRRQLIAGCTPRVSTTKIQFIQGNQLNMEKILEKFILHFNDIYGSQPDKFKEEDGRKLFLAVSAADYQRHGQLLH